MLPLRDKLRVICHQIKMTTKPVSDETMSVRLAERIKCLPNAEHIASMKQGELKELQAQVSNLMLDIEQANTSRTHDGYVQSMSKKGLPPYRKPVLPARNWYARHAALQCFTGLLKNAKRGDYAWVRVDLPKNVIEKMKAFGKEISDEDVYTADDDRYGRESSFHVTVKYGICEDDVEKVRDVLDGQKAGELYMGESSIFESEDEPYDVVKIEIESKDLKRLHGALSKLPNEDSHPVYKAHATIAYVKKGTGKKYVGAFKLDETIPFSKVVFETTTNEETTFTLEKD